MASLYKNTKDSDSDSDGDNEVAGILRKPYDIIDKHTETQLDEFSDLVKNLKINDDKVFVSLAQVIGEGKRMTPIETPIAETPDENMETKMNKMCLNLKNKRDEIIQQRKKARVNLNPPDFQPIPFPSMEQKNIPSFSVITEQEEEDDVNDTLDDIEDFWEVVLRSGCPDQNKIETLKDSVTRYVKLYYDNIETNYRNIIYDKVIDFFKKLENSGNEDLKIFAIKGIKKLDDSKIIIENIIKDQQDKQNHRKRKYNMGGKSKKRMGKNKSKKLKNKKTKKTRTTYRKKQRKTITRKKVTRRKKNN
jgi:hypothetical protein